MGQLEKYGLYVLCLLIFLIIGVSIWGEPANAATDPGPKNETAKVTKADKPAMPRVDLKELVSPVKPPASPVSTKGAEAPPSPLADALLDGTGSGGTKDAKKSDKNDAKVEPAKTEPKPDSGKRPTHRIKSGDTFESIAIELGDKKLVPVLLQLNPKIDPKTLAIGTEVQLPTPAELAAHKASAKGLADAGKGKADGKPADSKPADDPKKAAKAPETSGGVRTYTIAQGDTLSGLAKRLYGSDKRVDDIKGLNPSVDPTRLRIGQVIKLPAK
jgi:LysM repeat protein